MLTNFTTKAVTLFAATLLFAGSAFSQIRPYSLMYSGNVKGDIAVFGNTSMHIATQNWFTGAWTVQTARMNDIADANTSGGVGNTSYGNDNSYMKFIDIDTDNSTHNSSSANLQLPAGTNSIKFARLYWGGRIANSAINSKPDTLQKIRIKANSSAYFNITTAATNVDKTAATSTETMYQAYSDITAFVQQRGSGTYTIANLPATEGSTSNGGRYSGWAIVVVYENAALEYNSIRLYDGYDGVANGNSVNVTLNGLNAPNNALNLEDAKLTMIAWEGDGNLGATNGNPQGDYIKINGNTYSDPVNRSTNIWNGSISKNGAYVTDKNPSYANQMGLDIDEIQIGTGYGIQPNAASVNIEFGTEADQYFPSMFGFKLRVKDPLVSIQKNGTDVNGNMVIEPNEEITYTLSGSNAGSGTAFNVIVVDTLPASVTYIPGSMEIVQAPGTVLGFQTDAADAIDFSHVATHNGKTYLKFYIGNGATSGSGGTLSQNETFEIKFKVRGAAIPVAVNNTAIVFSNSEIGANYSDDATHIFSPSGAPLAVKLISFTGKLQNDHQALLQWATNEEINHDKFILERSEDAIHFEARAELKGNGNSASIKNYAYTDQLNSTAPVFYYRLKAVDLDGKYSYSKILPLRRSAIAAIGAVTAYPNPFVNEIKLQVSNNTPAQAEIKIFSMDGKLQLTRKVKMETGDQIISLQGLHTLQSGSYIVQIHTGTAKPIATKVVKL